jgi:uncharacterized protein YbjT (DUF2867 family)
MNVLVIGGSGLIGSRVIANLTELGHEAVSASPRSGVDSVSGEGLAKAVAGAHTVVDVSNSPSFDDERVLHFFTTSTGNLLAAERAAGVRHHVALSIVGADRTLESGYLRAKVAQEKLIEGSGFPYSIVRATQGRTNSRRGTHRLQLRTSECESRPWLRQSLTANRFQRVATGAVRAGRARRRRNR